MSRDIENERAVGFVVDCMSRLYNGLPFSRSDRPDGNTVGDDRTLQARDANGMVDNIFRDQNGKPLLALLPDGTVVPNGAASDEASLAEARKALMAPPKWPVRGS